MKMSSPTAEQIDAILPQTQCGLCGFKGCMPYAEALSKKEAEINLCPPGGVDGLYAIAALLEKNPEPFLSDMQQKAKPASVAIIREAECIGCTKCIQACPIDAILGSAKKMHTVIATECTGCELCVAPCPVDCIEMVIVPKKDENRSDHYRERYRAREARLEQKNPKNNPIPSAAEDKKAYIQAALSRIKAKQNK